MFVLEPPKDSYGNAFGREAEGKPEEAKAQKDKQMEQKEESLVNWEEKTEIELLALVYSYACNGLRVGKSKLARDWLKDRQLSMDLTMACFNSGQLHHRKAPEFKKSLERIGFMKESVRGSNCDSIAYAMFGIFSVMFPLRNPEKEIVNFYAVGLRNGKTAHLNHKGLYPGYPHEKTSRLYVTDNAVDAATILECRLLENRDAVIALHDGIVLDHHLEVIRGLKELKEIIQVTKTK
jgi:hypothetical protein